MQESKRKETRVKERIDRLVCGESSRLTNPETPAVSVPPPRLGPRPLVTLPCQPAPRRTARKNEPQDQCAARTLTRPRLPGSSGYTLRHHLAPSTRGPERYEIQEPEKPGRRARRNL